MFRNYTRNFSGSRAKEIVGWEPLEERRRALRLKLFHNIFRCRTGIEREKYFFRPDYVSLRLDHVNKVRELKCKTDVLRESFFPRTISTWNRLPRDTVTVMTNDAFFPCYDPICCNIQVVYLSCVCCLSFTVHLLLNHLH